MGAGVEKAFGATNSGVMTVDRERLAEVPPSDAPSAASPDVRGLFLDIARSTFATVAQTQGPFTFIDDLRFEQDDDQQMSAAAASATTKGNDGKKAMGDVVMGVDFVIDQVPDVFAYHFPCPDGLSCRVVAEDHFGPAAASKIDWRHWTHGKPAPLDGLDGKKIVIADACPGPAHYQTKLAKAQIVWTVDHHANDANRALKASGVADGFKESGVGHGVGARHMQLDESGVRCGALLLFQMWNPGKPVPAWLDAVNRGDTNLIRTRTPEQKAYHAWITQPSLIKDINRFRAACAGDVPTLTRLGAELLAQREVEVRHKVDQIKFRNVAVGARAYLAGYVDASGPEMLSMTADLVFALAKAQKLKVAIDFLAMRWTSDDGIKQISLRQIPALDVAEIATHFGGDGHPTAAGVQNRDYLE